MNTDINTYGDLEKFIQTLTEEQKKQAIKLIGADGQTVLVAEIADDRYLEHKTDENLRGTESEIKCMLDMANLPFIEKEYDVVEPKGFVLLHTGWKE